MKQAKELTLEEIPQAVAKAMGFEFFPVMDGKKVHSIHVYIEPPTEKRPKDRRSAVYNPLANHDQYESIMPAETWERVCDMLHRWFTERGTPSKKIDVWWRHAVYLENPRAWHLRALVEVMRNEQR